ncbi:hypothetical protein Taro_024913 [Colocasia esculenta]|uniref:Uncharacterized protein n=1 Tax=Colocasia esculenta TaxID=4460 RepID=A0A843V7I4_COLES|nr:hypothetical protein [Colocasia esculenta]
MQEKAKSILEEGRKSGKKESAFRGAEQRRQGKKKEKKKRRSSTVPCSLLSVAMLPQGLRCAVRLVGVFWRVFPERCLGGSGGGSPRTCLRCFCSSAYCSVFSDGPCCWPFGLCVLVKVLPRIAPLLILAEVHPRSARCSFWATIVFPLWFEVCRLVGVNSGEVLPRRLLALLVEVLHRAALCCFGRRCSLSL